MLMLRIVNASRVRLLSLVAGAALLSASAAVAQVQPAETGRAAARPTAERIVSLGGDATEILYALGLQDHIVAIDSTSIEPPEALKSKPNIGYMRQLSAEGVLSTGATIIVANAQAGPPEVVAALKSANLKYLALPGNESSHNIAEKVRVVGEAFGVTKQASELAGRIDDGLRALAARRQTITPPAKVIFVLGVSNGRATIGGKGTTADTMIELAGGINAAAGLNGYKSLTDEALLALTPDVVLTMRREGATDSATLIGSLPGYKQSPAGKQGRLIEMDAGYLLAFGPRTHEAARELMAKLYPALAKQDR